MAITEVDNPRRKKSGEEIFELITQRPMQNKLGNAYGRILKVAYDYSFQKNPFFQILAIDDVTKTTIIILMVLHCLLDSQRRPDLKYEYRLTEKGKRVYELLFLKPPTLH